MTETVLSLSQSSVSWGFLNVNFVPGLNMILLVENTFHTEYIFISFSSFPSFLTYIAQNFQYRYHVMNNEKIIKIQTKAT